MLALQVHFSKKSFHEIMYLVSYNLQVLPVAILSLVILLKFGYLVARISFLALSAPLYKNTTL